MRVYLAELKEIPKELSFDPAPEWMMKTIAECDEKGQTGVPDHLQLLPALRSRTASARISLARVDEVIVTQGLIDTQVQLICSRCGTAFAHTIHAKFRSLYARDPELAGVAHLGRSPGAHKNSPLKRFGFNSGTSRPFHLTIDDSEESDISFLPNDYLELVDVFKEQLSLALPIQPLCNEDCKGVCAHCGSDLNQATCSCERLKKRGSFGA
jgi:uncharacterized metal-binding protein YceD (DUF177 family)